MPAAKLKKAIISTRYPTARDLADLLQVPKGRVLQIAEELLEFQAGPAVGASRRAARNGAQSEKPSGTRTVKKRTTRAR
jgi:hypothetical protein